MSATLGPGYMIEPAIATTVVANSDSGSPSRIADTLHRATTGKE